MVMDGHRRASDACSDSAISVSSASNICQTIQGPTARHSTIARMRTNASPMSAHRFGKHRLTPLILENAIQALRHALVFSGDDPQLLRVLRIIGRDAAGDVAK